MRTNNHRTIILTAILVTACVALLVGCSDSSSGPSESLYLEATSPENVLTNFGRAYIERDVDEFLVCLSEDFRFYFTDEDQQGWPQFPPWFHKSDEQQVHENMFGNDYDVESITLTLVATSVETIPGEEARTLTGDAVVIRVETDFRIDKTGDVTWLATNPQEFRFREVAGSRESDGRTLWEMFEWHDLEDDEGGSLREDAGWGGIKYTFLESLSETSRRTSPAEVIDQLEAAYVALDVTSYLDCLAEDFTFFPNDADVQDPELDIPPEWYKSMEQIIHFNMFGGESNVASIQLTLTNALIFWDEQDPENPLDDIYSLTEDADLRVTVLGNLTFVATDPSMYLLRVDPDEEGPYGEIMWEIYEWHDLGDPGGGGASEYREYTSWGGIKAMYR
ncbi:MAG: hypothetical protein ABIK85_01760 [Candidatus Eisenbacteria bacterium]